MAVESLSSPIAQVSPEDLPDIMAYSLLRGFVADLSPRPTTPGMEMWAGLRFMGTGEKNHARWSETMVVDGVSHTVALYGVWGEKPGGQPYSHNALRCNCCLPNHKSFTDLAAEYQSCPAKDQVIARRTGVYKTLAGGSEFGSFDDDSLGKVTTFLVELVRKDPFAWPPSDRSDKLLVAPIAEILGVPEDRMLGGLRELAQDNVVHLHGNIHPSISLAA